MQVQSTEGRRLATILLPVRHLPEGSERHKRLPSLPLPPVPLLDEPCTHRCRCGLLHARSGRLGLEQVLRRKVDAGREAGQRHRASSRHSPALGGGALALGGCARGGRLLLLLLLLLAPGGAGSGVLWDGNPVEGQSARCAGHAEMPAKLRSGLSPPRAWLRARGTPAPVRATRPLRRAAGLPGGPSPVPHPKRRRVAEHALPLRGLGARAALQLLHLVAQAGHLLLQQRLLLLQHLLLLLDANVLLRRAMWRGLVVQGGTARRMEQHGAP